jgi:hypothetical protein
MITNLNTYLQGCVEKLCQGMGKKVTVVALGAAASFGAMSPTSASASANGGAITQLEFLQWMAQVSGDNDQFNANSKASDYVNWAKAKGMNPGTGWQPNAKLERSVLAQALVQLYNLNDKKYGGDYARILAREGIVLPDENEISRRGLVELLDEAEDRHERDQHHGHSPHKHPNNGKGNGDQPPPPRNPNGNPQDGDPGHNGGHNHQ